ncbi:MAG: biotin/lipoyl-binding protein [Bacteroidales bacterium]|nr:biotin/lipoyl-binding protein [Clostridium sp.]MCM1203601.1 biotin/lipoyl-binding protein [Bacteroidales bacterium]
MNLQGRKYLSGLMICLLLLCSGCGASTEVPELLEPVVNNQSFRPVERGRVGNSAVQIADVVPEEYCHFSKLATNISEVKVDLGDYVEEGTVLASIDTSEFTEEKKKLEAELAFRNREYTLKKQISGQQMTEQQLRLEECKKVGNAEEEARCMTQLSMIEENSRYDELYYAYQNRVISEKVKEIDDTIKEGTITARHAGYVTYIKDLTEGSNVNSMENIVIVSDYDKLHLELEEDISSRFYEQIIYIYEEEYLLVGGKQYKVEPYEYSNEQLIAIQSNTASPKIRLEITDKIPSLNPGDKMPVYFSSNLRTDVLKVGTDSLNQEGEQYFVYVKNGMDMERRDIEVGLADATSVEVLKGLEEGEWVYYTSTASLPQTYDTYQVKKGEFTSENMNRDLRYFHAYSKVYSYMQSIDSTVESLNVKKGDAVKKGDLLCVLDTGQGSAQIKEAAAALNNLQIDYEKNAGGYDKEIAALNQRIAEKKAEEEQIAAEPEPGTEKPGEETPTEEPVTEEPVSEEPATEETPEEEPVTEETSTEAPSAEEAGEMPLTETQPVELEQPTGNGITASPEIAVTETSAMLECQRNVMIYQKDIVEAEYQYNRALLQQDYDKAARENDGSGKREIYAEQDGIVGNLNIYAGKQIVAKEDGNLFQIFDAASPKLMIDTGDNLVGAGNTVVFTPKSGDAREYTGKVVGNSAVAGKVYLSNLEDKVYVTTSVAGQKRNQSYIAMDDKSFYENQTDCKISYANARIQDSIVLPADMLNAEVNKQDAQTYYFVWKLVDDALVKQYVKVNETLMTETEVCILDGLKDGDLVAKLKVEE